MKRCGTHSPRPADEYSRNATSRVGVVALVVAALLASACVTRGTHREVVDERDALVIRARDLDKRVELLTASNESLGTERVNLIDEMEDLRQRRRDLESDVARLARAEAELSETLASRDHQLSKLRGTYDGLVSDLEEEVAAGEIQIEQLRSGLRLNLTQDVLFASGSSGLNAAGRSVLSKVAVRLRELRNLVQVQGHTDDVPIRGSGRFPTNWELAAARASQVVRLLAEQGIAPTRLRAVSYGEYRPIASNETAEGRAMNRRIEIRLEPIREEDEPVTANAGEGAPAP